MALMASYTDLRKFHPARELAVTIGVSESHLAKVLQRLARNGLLESVRGARGGYRLARRPDEITLLEILETADSRALGGMCLLGQPVCAPGQCVFGELSRRVEVLMRGALGCMSLEEFVSRQSPFEQA
jgi:Rrf2 family protein